MIRYNHIHKNDYDKLITIGNKNVLCYSKKMLKELYPEKNFVLVGETPSKKEKSEYELSERKKRKLDEKRVGKLHFADEVYNVLGAGAHNSVLHKNQGYICVGGDNYVAVKDTRAPFIIALSAMSAATVACIVLMVIMVINREPPIIVELDHPLPDVDENVEKIEDTTDDSGVDIDPNETTGDPSGGDPDDPDKPDAPDDTTGDGTSDGTSAPDSGEDTTTVPDTTVVLDPDETFPPETEAPDEPDSPSNPSTPSKNQGGSVSMIYTLNAHVSLGKSNEQVAIHFQNPNASTHAVKIKLHIVKNGVRYVAAESELIPIGYGLYKLTLSDNAPSLSAGIYQGLYEVAFYDQNTGEKAAVNSEIPGVRIIVTK